MSMRPHETCKPWRKTLRGEKRRRRPSTSHTPITLRVVHDEFGDPRLVRIGTAIDERWETAS